MNTKSLSGLALATMFALMPATTAQAAVASTLRAKTVSIAAAAKTGSLTIAVRTSKGAAGKGMLVELLKNRGDMPPIHATTNDSGYAHFDRLPADWYLALVYDTDGSLIAWSMVKVTPDRPATMIIGTTPLEP